MEAKLTNTVSVAANTKFLVWDHKAEHELSENDLPLAEGDICLVKNDKDDPATTPKPETGEPQPEPNEGDGEGNNGESQHANWPR